NLRTAICSRSATSSSSASRLSWTENTSGWEEKLMSCSSCSRSSRGYQDVVSTIVLYIPKDAHRCSGGYIPWTLYAFGGGNPSLRPPNAHGAGGGPVAQLCIHVVLLRLASSRAFRYLFGFRILGSLSPVGRPAGKG